MHPELTVITIVYNEVDRILATCKSIDRQAYDNVEWIVLDGGSSDGTLDILNQYTSEIDILISEPDRGIYHAMNKGIALASGEYILFMNGGDEFYTADILADVIPHLDSDIVYGNLLMRDGVRDHMRHYPSTLTSKYFLREMLPHQATFYKKTLFDEAGLYDESFRIAGDYEFNTRIFKTLEPSYKHLNLTISVFYTDGISSSQQHRMLRKKENHRVRMKYFMSYKFSFKAFRQIVRNLFA